MRALERGAATAGGGRQQTLQRGGALEQAPARAAGRRLAVAPPAGGGRTRVASQRGVRPSSGAAHCGAAWLTGHPAEAGLVARRGAAPSVQQAWQQQQVSNLARLFSIQDCILSLAYFHKQSTLLHVN